MSILCPYCYLIVLVHIWLDVFILGGLMSLYITRPDSVHKTQISNASLAHLFVHISIQYSEKQITPMQPTSYENTKLPPRSNPKQTIEKTKEALISWAISSTHDRDLSKQH